MPGKFVTDIYKTRNAELEAQCLRPGYYLVKGDKRYFVSVDVSESALNQVCDRVLSDAKGWDYWIDYSYGPSVNGGPAWANIDYTDRFI